MLFGVLIGIAIGFGIAAIIGRSRRDPVAEAELERLQAEARRREAEDAWALVEGFTRVTATANAKAAQRDSEEAIASFDAYAQAEAVVDAEMARAIEDARSQGLAEDKAGIHIESDAMQRFMRAGAERNVAVDRAIESYAEVKKSSERINWALEQAKAKGKVEHHPKAFYDAKQALDEYWPIADAATAARTKLQVADR